MHALKTLDFTHRHKSVSYTHLDVYKRQIHRKEEGRIKAIRRYTVILNNNPKLITMVIKS